MAPGTINWWIYLLLHDNFCAKISLIGRRLPCHVGNLSMRPQIWTRIAMAIETPAHRQRLCLPDFDHLGDITMATAAPDPGREMGAVIEIGVIGQFMDAYPFQRCP